MIDEGSQTTFLPDEGSLCEGLKQEIEKLKKRDEKLVGIIANLQKRNKKMYGDNKIISKAFLDLKKTHADMLKERSGF